MIANQGFLCADVIVKVSGLLAEFLFGKRQQRLITMYTRRRTVQ